MAAITKATWRAATGVNWPDGKGGERRAEPGDPVPDVVVRDNPWLVEQGAVVKAIASAPSVATGDGGTEVAT